MSSFVLVVSKRARSNVGIELVLLEPKNFTEFLLTLEISSPEEAKQIQKKLTFGIRRPGCPEAVRPATKILKNHEKSRKETEKNHEIYF